MIETYLTTRYRTLLFLKVALSRVQATQLAELRSHGPHRCYRDLAVPRTATLQMQRWTKKQIK
jgi:hypothetical protein